MSILLIFHKLFYFLAFKFDYFNGIQNKKIPYNSKSNISIELTIKNLNRILTQFHKTVLFNAIIKKDIEIIKLLLNCGRIDINLLVIS